MTKKTNLSSEPSVDNLVHLKGATSHPSTWTSERAEAWFLQHARGIIDYEWRASYTTRQDAVEKPSISSLDQMRTPSNPQTAKGLAIVAGAADKTEGSVTALQKASPAFSDTTTAVKKKE